MEGMCSSTVGSNYLCLGSQPGGGGTSSTVDQSAHVEGDLWNPQSVGSDSGSGSGSGGGGGGGMYQLVAVINITAWNWKREQNQEEGNATKITRGGR